MNYNADLPVYPSNTLKDDPTNSGHVDVLAPEYRRPSQYDKQLIVITSSTLHSMQPTCPEP